MSGWLLLLLLLPVWGGCASLTPEESGEVGERLFRNDLQAERVEPTLIWYRDENCVDPSWGGLHEGEPCWRAMLRREYITPPAYAPPGADCTERDWCERRILE